MWVPANHARLMFRSKRSSFHLLAIISALGESAARFGCDRAAHRLGDFADLADVLDKFVGE